MSVPAFQNKNSFTISVPTEGSAVVVNPGYCVAGSYYSSIANHVGLTLLVGPVPAGKLVYTYPESDVNQYNAVQGANKIWAAPDGTSGAPVFRKIVAGDLPGGYSGVGESGKSGYSGTSGANGTSGWSGKSGYSGPPGSTGSRGQSGVSGYSGTSGYSGYSGSGKSGWSGVSGYSGQAGGESGTSGFSGYSGVDGASGWSGKSGWSGVGTSGWSGFSGATGAGTSGWSGYSGASVGLATGDPTGTSHTAGYMSVSGTTLFLNIDGASGYLTFTGIPA